MLLFTAINAGTEPIPEADKPIEVLSFVQLNVTLGVVLTKLSEVTKSLLHIVLLAGTVKSGWPTIEIVNGIVESTPETELVIVNAAA